EWLGADRVRGRRGAHLSQACGRRDDGGRLGALVRDKLEGASAAYCALTRTYEPGASSMAFSLPDPGTRALTSPPEYCSSHFRHSGHHEPACWVAPSSQASGVSAFFSLVQ